VTNPGSIVMPTRHVRARLLVVLLLAFGALVYASGPAGADATKDVSITDSGFGPPTLEVAGGDTVTWTNDGSVAHDVSADDGTFQSGPMSPGQSFTFTFDTEGTYAYRSTTDADLTGSVVVGGAAIGSAQSVSPFAATDNVPATPDQAVAAPDQFAYTGAAETIALAVLGTVALLFGWAVVTGFGSPFGSIEPWRILALADPRRLGFTDELMPRGRWRRTPRRSRQADLLPARSHPASRVGGSTAGPSATRADRRRGGRGTTRRRTVRRYAVRR
jgi:plastocyanin